MIPFVRIPRYDTTEEESDEMSDVAVVERSDGRNHRRARTTDALRQAGMDLVLQSNFRPSDRTICAKAGTSVRTFYQIFQTTEGFWDDVIRHYPESLKAKLTSVVEEHGADALLRLILIGKM
jgi:hypothetical protein